jgi:hypothetical protein
VHVRLIKGVDGADEGFAVPGGGYVGASGFSGVVSGGGVQPVGSPPVGERLRAEHQPDVGVSAGVQDAQGRGVGDRRAEGVGGGLGGGQDQRDPGFAPDPQ